MENITYKEINEIKFLVDGENLTINEFFDKGWGLEWLPILSTDSNNYKIGFITYHVTTCINKRWNRFNTTVTRFSRNFVDPIKTTSHEVTKFGTDTLYIAITKHNEFIEEYLK
jgi:hypothetical protein